MKVFIVYAHPEPTSLTGSLKDVAIKFLEGSGHEVKVSDLYGMKFKAVGDGKDFLEQDPSQPVDYMLGSKAAYENGTQAPDIVAEQEKMRWFHMPAILKGWVDRVYAFGFAYGVGEMNEKNFFDRYGQGNMAGKRAMVVTLTGGSAEHYSARGINGVLHDVLFQIQHGILFYPGFQVLPPFVVHRAKSKVTPERYLDIKKDFEERLSTLATTEPIKYRKQNFGDYFLPSLILKPGLEKPGTTGNLLHIAD